MQQLKVINSFQTAQVMAVLYLIGAYVIAIPVALFSLGFSLYQGSSPLKALLFLLAPLAYGIFAFIGIIFFCALYNVVAKRMGGIEFEIGPR